MPLRPGPLRLLIVNHADAWVSTLAIAVGALILHDGLVPSHLLLALAVATGYWLAFAINDYFDAPIDRLDPRKAQRNYFVQQYIPPRAAFLGLLLVCLVLLPIFIAFGWMGVLVAFVSSVVMWAYSAPPLRLKSRPGIDLLTHAVFVQTFPYAAVIWMTGAHWTRLDTILIVIGLWASALAQLEQQIRDVNFDSLWEQTLTSRLGVTRALIWLKAGTAGLLVFSLYPVVNGMIPLPVAGLGLLTLPAVIPRFWRQAHQPRPERLIQALVVVGLVYVLVLITWSSLAGGRVGMG